MSLTADDFAEFLREALEDEQPLGDSLSELAIDVDLDSVESVREMRDRT